MLELPKGGKAAFDTKEYKENYFGWLSTYTAAVGETIEYLQGMVEVGRQYQLTAGSLLRKNGLIGPLPRSAYGLKLGSALKVLGKAAPVVLIVTTVLEVLADKDKWALTLANAGFGVGAGFAASVVVGTTAVQSALNSPLLAIGVPASKVTAGVALLAAGLVIAITSAASALFSVIFKALFGGGIPADMRLSMAAPMVSPIRSGMAAPMSLRP